MSRIALQLDISETGAYPTGDLISLGSNSKHVVASEYYLCPLLSISLAANQTPHMNLHSPIDTLVKIKPDTQYLVLDRDDDEYLLPKSGSEYFELAVGDVFSFTETKSEYCKKVQIRVFSIL